MIKLRKGVVLAMMKKLGIVAMAGFFTVSVAGLSFADEPKPAAAPAATNAPALPDVGKEIKGEMKGIKKKAGKMKEEAVIAVTPPIVAPAPALPDVGKEIKGEMKGIKKKAGKMKEEAVIAVTPPIVAPALPPTHAPEKK